MKKKIKNSFECIEVSNSQKKIMFENITLKKRNNSFLYVASFVFLFFFIINIVPSENVSEPDSSAVNVNNRMIENEIAEDELINKDDEITDFLD